MPQPEPEPPHSPPSPPLKQKSAGAFDPLIFVVLQTVITAEHSRALFGKEWASPYASFAPKVADPLRCRNLTVCLRDGTVHLQTITPAADPWLHSLLGHVGAHTGCPCLMNVGLRRRGKPLMNRISEALQQLQEAQLDFVVVEGRVFDRI